MWRWARRAPALVPLAFVGVAGLCELAEQVDDTNKPQYAKRRLRALRNAAPSVTPSAGASEAWLNAETPQFPYLLAISSGDDPGAVIDG